MKKFFITIVAATFAFAAFAETPEQIQKGSILIETVVIGETIGADNTSMGLRFTNGVAFGFSGTGGYFIMDKLAGLGKIGLSAQSGWTQFNFSLGGRYYPLTLWKGSLFGDFLFNLATGGGNGRSETVVGITINAGYAFFLNRHVSVEPLMYLDIPFKKGHKVNLGIGAAISIYL